MCVCVCVRERERVGVGVGVGVSLSFLQVPPSLLPPSYPREEAMPMMREREIRYLTCEYCGALEPFAPGARSRPGINGENGRGGAGRQRAAAIACLARLMERTASYQLLCTCSPLVPTSTRPRMLPAAVVTVTAAVAATGRL